MRSWNIFKSTGSGVNKSTEPIASSAPTSDAAAVAATATVQTPATGTGSGFMTTSTMTAPTSITSSSMSVRGGEDEITSFSVRDSQRNASSGQGGNFIGFRSQRSKNDARMERNVCVAARNLGDGVLNIVMAAKAKEGNNGEWKEQLTALLGAGTTSVATNEALASLSTETGKSDIDVLLESSKCENFVQRCVENELPPNLIHSLRLLRVLELQHASDNADSNGRDPVPVSVKATAKVSRLLCILCSDPSVGEQLRPHLFGLLALSGASYPPSGIHVAHAASDVIIAFAESCLTRQLVWFIHDRKMIVHMTDDIKDLSGLSKSSAPPIPMGLTGQAAEQTGLWAIALRTVARLVSCSCRHRSVELVRDFEAAGGYEVLRHAIEHGSRPYGKQYMELLPILASCSHDMVDDDTGVFAKLAMNIRIFEIQEDLLYRSNPLLRAYQTLNQQQERPDPTQPGAVEGLAALAIQTACRNRGGGTSSEGIKSEFGFDVTSELLSITLQLFADHPRNYEILEERQHVLTYYLLSLPCFDDADLKNHVLKTLEFVLTGVGIADEVTPVHACVEIFFALCRAQLRGAASLEDDIADKQQVLALLAADADLMGNTLEKLLQFDQRVAPLMVEASSILGSSLDSLLSILSDGNDSAANAVPPTSTPHDKTFRIVCQVIKLLMAHQPVGYSADTHSKESQSDVTQRHPQDTTNLHTLLWRATKELGNEAARAAAGVFEAYMASLTSPDDLSRDMRFVLQMVDDLVELTKVNSSTIVAETIVERLAGLLSMIRSVLESRSLPRESFRTLGGFSSLVRVVMSFRNMFAENSNVPEEFSRVVIQLLQTVIGLLEAAIGLKYRNQAATSDSWPLMIPGDTLVDPVSSQLSIRSPSSVNRTILRTEPFYIDLAAAIAGTGLLSDENASSVIDLALGHVDPCLKAAEKNTEVLLVRNPDAIRLLLGLTLYLPNSEVGASQVTRVMGTIMLLSEKSRSATTLLQLSSSGLSHSLTSTREFGQILFGGHNRHRGAFVDLLARLASFSMSYVDFISILRCIAGPVIGYEGSDMRPRLPIISSSIKRSSSGYSRSFSGSDSQWREREFSERLETIRAIAQSGDRIHRVRLGGDSINTIAVLMHQIRLEERLRAASEEGRLKFIEIESIEASALGSEVATPAASSGSTPNNPNERIWTPLAGSGFSYSLWLRHEIPIGTGTSGSFYILDMSSSLSQGSAFLSVWYDIQNQRFNVLTSASYRSEPTCFPVSPLLPNIWHHILLTYTPSKRSMMSRKSAISIYVDGRALEAEVKVDSVSLPPNSRLIIGAPNPSLAVSGIVRGMLPVWELGPALMLGAVLLDLDAAAIYCYGPDFPGLLWGDRPQRQSLAATATATFSMLAETGEVGSVAGALRRRDIVKMEEAGHSTVGYSVTDDLSTLSLLCNIPPDCLVFGFLAETTTHKVRNESIRGDKRMASERLVNLARLNFGNEFVATDAIIYGKAVVVTPLSFAESLQWAGGPSILLPLVNSAKSPESLALALSVIREGVRGHRPNLEMMQAGGCYRILGVLLKDKIEIDERSLDQCLDFAVHGVDASIAESRHSGDDNEDRGSLRPISLESLDSSHWVFSDLDAMKYLLLNHQIWSLRKYGPDMLIRLLSGLNCLVDQRSVHKAFNARRLHQVGIVRWALHLMIEAADLYTAGEYSFRQKKQQQMEPLTDTQMYSWYCESPLVADVSVGGDPGNPFLLQCKSLLRRVLTFMLTPGDLEALAESIIFTAAIAGNIASRSGFGKLGRAKISSPEDSLGNDERMLPGSTMRLHLVRLLEELIVDGVNEIVSAGMSSPSLDDPVIAREHMVQPHAGGVASPNQPYFSTGTRRGRMSDGRVHPKHQQAQAFLSAFAGYLTPSWFATVLEGCREEASASATLRLMTLMIQGSASFESAFKAAGAYAPFVLSIPKYSTCPSISMSMLSQLLNVPILHLHSLPVLHGPQLCEVFDDEDDNPIVNDNDSDPSSGIFALLAECLGRNIQLIVSGHDLSEKAAVTNQAIFYLLVHRHTVSPAFQDFCSTPAFFEPLSHALCLLHDDKAQTSRTSRSKRKRSVLADVPKDLSPIDRYVGSLTDPDSTGMGIVRLLSRIIARAITSAPKGCELLSSIFRAFPIHASPKQVEVFHLILIEQCHLAIADVLPNADSLALANCIGICSVLLDRLVGSFFTSEAALQAVRTSISVLNALTNVESATIEELSTAEHSMLTMDASQIANLTCVAALRLSLPVRFNDPGDEDLQGEVLHAIDTNHENLLLIPSRDRKSRRKIPSGKFPKQPSAKLANLWHSGSIARSSPGKEVLFPDLSDTENPDQDFIAPLLVLLHKLLASTREDIRSLAISILVSLLQHRPTVMSELLVAEVQHGEQKETIDVVSRGGFRALLAAQEAATAAENATGVQSVRRKYAAFFNWFEKHQSQVQLVFESIESTGNRVFPGLDRIAVPQSEAVENEQKLMLMRLTSESGDRSILGGLERGELSRRCTDRTSDYHSRWKRQGFDDLAYGAMKWKILLRQLKGSRSIWEGGSRNEEKVAIDLDSRLKLIEKYGGAVTAKDANKELVKRWKLDLTEGYERQRRRLLPNYEFHALYNLDEDDIDAGISSDDIAFSPAEEGHQVNGTSGSEFLVGAGQMEATAALLKDLNLKRLHKSEENFGYDDAEADDMQTVASTLTSNSAGDTLAQDEVDLMDRDRQPELGLPGEDAFPQRDESEDSSSYELITGLLQPGDWPENSYNVCRCTGLEVTKALLLWCRDAIYIIDGFEQTGGDGMEGKISRVEREKSSFYISLRPKNFKAQEDERAEGELTQSAHDKGAALSKPKKDDIPRLKSHTESSNEVIYEHRSTRIPFLELYAVYRRRYQLQQNALEFYDVSKRATLISFETVSVREEVLSKVLQSQLPNSIFNSTYGTFSSYSKFMNNLKAKVFAQWVQGKMTNFDFLMQLNTLAGRSFNDLTQYPVFPWVIADYESEELDLSDPKTFRDLSKPMGAIGPERAKQFRERYEALDTTYFSEDDPPPFHYGTHYSSAAYVLYYLMRLEPFSRLALALQGGKFDVADRLFHDVGRSWKSASSENLQDVRELIPEFFYLPDFLENTNNFDFGETQRGKTVHDVTLPKWAKGDPALFVRINRQALESEHVSRNLHQWVDLVFGYKQRGKEAVEALNTFVHVTYEGQVDLDSMTDPVQRASTIAQIQNFGQTPSRLERKPTPQRTVVQSLKDGAIDFGALPSLAALTPAFCVVGARCRVHVRPTLTDTCKLGLMGQVSKSVGDMCLVKGQVVGVGRSCSLVIPAKRYIRFGGLNNGLSVHTAAITSRHREVNKLLSIHDGLHRAPVVVAKASLDGNWIVTGCIDSTIRVWRYDGSSVKLEATLCGHDGHQVKCIDISTEFGVIASGCSRGRVLLWDIRTLTYVRSLSHEVDGEAMSISINHKNGNILSLVGGHMNIFDINGNMLACCRPGSVKNLATCCVATDCPEWMEDGIVAITGHETGEVQFWGISFERKELVMRQQLDANPHTAAITSLRVTGTERQDTLLVGDSSGKMTCCKTVQLDSYSPEELAEIAAVQFSEK